MQWSKTKKTLERFLCDKCKGRIEVHATVYRKFHDQPGRVWITFDKKEIVSASDTTYAMKHAQLYNEIVSDNQLKGIPEHLDCKEKFDSEERKKLIDAADAAEEVLTNQNVFETYHLYEPFMKYSSLSIDEAIHSENPIIRAFSMLDRRLGKRRLKDIHLSDDAHPLVIQCYNIRCDVEGISDCSN